MRTETFSTPGAVRLDLDIPSGAIEIETGAADETRVELEALSSSDAVRELIDTARIELVRRGDGHEVVVDVRTRWGFWISFDRGPDIRLRVTCPEGSDLDIRTKAADVQANGRFGEAEVKTASGDVTIQEARGDLRVKTASGDVRSDEVGGRLEVNTVSGDLHVDHVAGDASIQVVSGDVYIREADASVSANTVSGDQRIEVVSSGRIDLRAINGDVSVGVRQGSRLFVDANTISGSTSSEVELGDAPADAGGDDKPLVELYAKTVSGDIRIERAPAAWPTPELSERS
jgi:DUF4097 and DUF4098 domain-containing protein YvlB